MFGNLAIIAPRFASFASLFSAPATESTSTMATTSEWVAFWAACFVFIFAFRYLRTVVSIYSWNTYKAKPILETPIHKPRDISVIVPTTFKKPDELLECLKGILRCQPYHIFVVTADANVALAQELMAANDLAEHVKCLGVEHLNKRDQILRALPSVRTEFVTLADDDVFWPGEDYLKHVLAIFEDPKVGAGGTRQRVKREENPGFWNMLGISYLERRVWNNCATNAVDGSISTLSGRTATYRASILQDPAFQWYFKNDSWRGKPLNSDDDKCLTRYVYSQGWKITLQFAPEATLETTVENDIKYLSQCLRWARAHWRGNFTVMENEKYWLPIGHWWGFYYIYLGQFQTPAVVWEGILFFFLHQMLQNALSKTSTIAYLALAAWIFFTKNMKMIPYFRKHPADLKWIPVLMLFSYFHGFLNIYAACTMTVTHWGSQELKTLEQAREPSEVVPLLAGNQKRVDSVTEPIAVPPSREGGEQPRDQMVA